MTIQEELSKLRKEEISPHLSNALCQKHIHWLKQAKKEGIDWQKLEALADSGQVASKKKRVEFKAGTKLLREYQGKTHQVLVVNEGFLYEDTLYKSLTAIANAITGKKWNGRVFFKVHLSSCTFPRGNAPPCNSVAQKVACAERCLQHPILEVAEYGK